MPLSILVADDDLGTRLSISDYLEAAGYLVIPAENGREALSLVEEYQPHLIVTDITMPQMDGYEFVRRIRQRPALRLLPVIFLTARTDMQERIRGYQIGCDMYLAKPFELQELGAIVRNLLERLQLIESEWRTRSPVSSTSVKQPRTGVDALASASEAATLEATATITNLSLTSREVEVLKVLLAGLSNVQIGEQLHLSPRTVEKHISSLLRKTNTNNRADLVRFSIQQHLIE